MAVPKPTLDPAVPLHKVRASWWNEQMQEMIDYVSAVGEENEEGLFALESTLNSQIATLQTNVNEQLTDKADVDLSNCTKPYITETYKNGTSWYNIYSNGWCEQGGYASQGTTILLKSYIDTNYTILFGSNSSWMPYITSKAVDSITVYGCALSGNNWLLNRTTSYYYYCCGKIL